MDPLASGRTPSFCVCFHVASSVSMSPSYTDTGNTGSEPTCMASFVRDYFCKDHISAHGHTLSSRGLGHQHVDLGHSSAHNRCELDPSFRSCVIPFQGLFLPSGMGSHFLIAYPPPWRPLPFPHTADSPQAYCPTFHLFPPNFSKLHLTGFHVPRTRNVTCAPQEC